MRPAVVETLREAQRLGFLGPGLVEVAARHAVGFVEALSIDGPPLGPIVDLGSGGGLPGLVIAELLPAVEVWLTDRRQKRTDFLERAVGRLEFAHAVVWAGDVHDLARQVDAGTIAKFGAATARGFGPPAATLQIAHRLVAQDEPRIVISEPPSGDRWSSAVLDRMGLRVERIGHVALFRAATRP